jgi:hypothetical protein
MSIITPLPDTIRALKNKEIGKRMFMDLWNEHTGIKHSKMMMTPFKEGTNKLIKLKRTDLRVMIGILTGHGCLRKFLYRIGKAENPYCLGCEEEYEEDMKHLLCDCPAFTGTRRQIFGTEHPDESFLKNAKSSLLLKFAKKSELYETFFRD